MNSLIGYFQTVITKIRDIAIEKYRLALGALIIIMCAGYFLTYLGFAKPRGFKGDFYAAMYDPKWWNGEGIFYGPIFVFERWAVNSIPSLVNVQFFAIGCLILIATALLITIRIVRADRALMLFCFVTWALNTYFYYSFSVAANPELIELVLVLMMWWSFSRKRYVLGWIALTCAVLTKLAPIIFLPLLLFFFSWSGLIQSFIIFMGVLLIVSIGQNQSILSSISQIIHVKTAGPQPASEQYLGLSSGLARLFGMQPGENFHYVLLLANVLIFVSFLISVIISFRIFTLKRNLEHEVKVAYIFALFITLLPFFHFSQTHRHTYLFLAPVFIALKYLYLHDTNGARSRIFSRFTTLLFFTYSFLPLYFLDFNNIRNLIGFPFGGDFRTSAVMLTEPVWTNLVLLGLIIIYGFSLCGKKENRGLAV